MSEETRADGISGHVQDGEEDYSLTRDEYGNQHGQVNPGGEECFGSLAKPSRPVASYRMAPSSSSVHYLQAVSQSSVSNPFHHSQF